MVFSLCYCVLFVLLGISLKIESIVFAIFQLRTFDLLTCKRSSSLPQHVDTLACAPYRRLKGPNILLRYSMENFLHLVSRSKTEGLTTRQGQGLFSSHSRDS